MHLAAMHLAAVHLAVMVLGLCACGRIGFDPMSAGGTGDGGSGADAIVGGAGENCASAGVLVIGQPLSGQSVASAANDVTTALCPDGVDVVFAVTSATSGLRMVGIDADFGGSLVTAATCPPISGNCSGFLANTPQNSMTSIPAGTTFVIVEKTSGTGTTFSLSVE